MKERKSRGRYTSLSVSGVKRFMVDLSVESGEFDLSRVMKIYDGILRLVRSRLRSEREIILPGLGRLHVTCRRSGPGVCDVLDFQTSAALLNFVHGRSSGGDVNTGIDPRARMSLIGSKLTKK